MKKVRVGIIGLGRISPLHIEGIEAVKNAELVAACDIDKNKFDSVENKKGIRFYTSYQEMLDTEKLDAVHICLPHNLHTVVGRYAIERGVHVLSEKPMSVDYESAEALVEYAEEKDVLYGIIFQCRYNPSVRFVKKTLSENKLGKIISASSILTWYRSDEYYGDDDWHGTWDKEGGGVIINQAIHSVDMVNYFVDSPIRQLDCSMRNRMHKTIEVEDTAEGMVVYENGTRYVFYATNNYGTSVPIRVSLYCEKGTVECDYDNAVITYNDGTREQVHGENAIEQEEGRETYWGNQHINQIAQFYRAVSGQEKLEISGREALKSHKLICEIYKKGKENFIKA